MCKYCYSKKLQIATNPTYKVKVNSKVTFLPYCSFSVFEGVHLSLQRGRNHTEREEDHVRQNGSRFRRLSHQ